MHRERYEEVHRKRGVKNDHAAASLMRRPKERLELRERKKIDEKKDDARSLIKSKSKELEFIFG